MTTDIASRRARTVACMVLAGALTQCSASPTPPVAVQPPPPPVVVAAEPPVDLSPAPAPDALLVTIRSPSPRGTARHLGERLGLGELVSSMEEQIPSMFGDDAALVHALDLDAPVDVVVYLGEHDRARLVLSFGALSMPRAEDALSQGHRLTPVSNGVRRIERTPAPEGNAGPECALSPAFGDAHAARIVCSDHFEDIGAVLPYLTRTLPRTPLAADAGDLVIEVAPDQLRARFSDDLRTTTERMVSRFGHDADPADHELVEQVRAYLRDQLARSLNQGLADLDVARLSLRFHDGATRLHGELGFRGVSAPLVERFFGAMRDAHPSVDLLHRLAPGATSYYAGATSIASLRPELDLVGPVLARLLTPASAHLPAADVTALRNAITTAFRMPGYNRVVSAGSSSVAADNTRWTLATYQLDAPAAPSVTSFRGLLTALRRPAIARYANTELHLNPATIRTPPTPGLPAGTLHAIIPIPAGGTPDLRQMFRTGAQLEVLLVPDGNNLWVGYGANVLAHYREARANHASPVEIPGLTADHVVFAGTTLPMGIAHLISQIDPQMGRAVERGFQNTPNGNAPLTFTVTAQQGAHGASTAGDFVIPDSVLHAVGGMFRQSP